MLAKRRKHMDVGRRLCAMIKQHPEMKKIANFLILIPDDQFVRF